MSAPRASSTAAVPTASYLLFSGPLDRPDVRHCRPAGFDCEESARLAFIGIRLQASSQSMWAELVAVHADEKPETLCWFGTPTSRADHLVGAATTFPLSFPRRRLPMAGYLSTGPSARWAGVLALLGLLLAAVAVWALGDGASAPAAAHHAPVSLASAVDVSTLATHGPVALRASASSYAPRQTSGWHRHTGLHLVTVVPGTQTLDDRECTAATHSPGQSYLGGDEPHLARNETEAALDMVVT